MASDSKADEQDGKDNGLPTIILGSMEFSRRLNLEDSQVVTEKFLDAGFREIDTAFVYNDGQTERFIEKILCQTKSSVSKNEILIQTKANPFATGGLSKQGIEFQVNTSLKRLNVDCVDLLYLHLPDYDHRIEESLEAVNELYKQKKFKRFGLSNFSAWQVAQIYYLCKSNNYGFLPTVYQGMYNPITRDCERELFPCLREFNISFYSFNIIAGGLLSGKHKNYDAISDADKNIAQGRFHGKDIVAAQMYRQRYWKKSYFDAISIIDKALIKEKRENNNDISMVEASMRWMQHHSMLTNKDGVILGASSLKHFDENMNALQNKEKLPQTIVDAFDQAWDVCKQDVPLYFKSVKWCENVKARRAAKK